jgi:hypothetical protein
MLIAIGVITLNHHSHLDRLWNEFVQCVRDYSQTCLATGDRLRQQQLQGALDEAVRSVDAMCTDPTYQQGIVPFAECS